MAGADRRAEIRAGNRFGRSLPINANISREVITAENVFGRREKKSRHSDFFFVSSFFKNKIK